MAAVSKIVETDGMRYEKVINMSKILANNYFKNQKVQFDDLITNETYFISFEKCVIAAGDKGIMILLKSNYMINMIDSQRHNDIKISLRYFNIKDGTMHPTEKTEIELDYEVNIMQWNK